MSTFNDIARYAEGDMTIDEQAAFEATLAADETLRQQLALYRETHGSLQLQHTLHHMRSEFFNAVAPAAKVVSFNKYLRSAVAVAAILLAVVFVWQPWKPGLFKTYADTTMVAPAERGGNAADTLQRAVDAFNKKDFTAAAALLAQVRLQDTTNSYVNFYYGIALLQTGQLAQATSQFNQLYAGQSIFQYEAAFYQALVYLKEDNKAACKAWLQKIPADASNYNKAQELLNKL